MTEYLSSGKLTRMNNNDTKNECKFSKDKTKLLADLAKHIYKF